MPSPKTPFPPARSRATLPHPTVTLTPKTPTGPVALGLLRGLGDPPRSRAPCWASPPPPAAILLTPTATHPCKACCPALCTPPRAAAETGCTLPQQAPPPVSLPAASRGQRGTSVPRAPRGPYTCTFRRLCLYWETHPNGVQRRSSGGRGPVPPSQRQTQGQRVLLPSTAQCECECGPVLPRA